MEAGDEGIERVEDSKDLQQQSKALDKLTDHVEDRQLNSTRVQEVFLLTYCYFDYIYIYICRADYGGFGSGDGINCCLKRS